MGLVTLELELEGLRGVVGKNSWVGEQGWRVINQFWGLLVWQDEVEEWWGRTGGHWDCLLSLPGTVGTRKAAQSWRRIIPMMAPVKISHVVSFSSQVLGPFPGVGGCWAGQGLSV